MVVGQISKRGGTGVLAYKGARMMRDRYNGETTDPGNALTSTAGNSQLLVTCAFLLTPSQYRSSRVEQAAGWVYRWLGPPTLPMCEPTREHGRVIYCSPRITN